MITEEGLKQICEEYDIDYKKLIAKNSNVLTYAHKDDIYYVLNFLKTEVNIESKNIEKCPSYTDDPRKMGTVFLSTADE